MKTIQTNCIQTQLDEHTGKLIGYRLTFPIPKELANICESKSIVRGKKGTNYYVTFHEDFDTITRIKIELQLKVTRMKIQALQRRHVYLTTQYSLL